MMTTGVVQQERGWVFCVHLIRDSFGDVGRHTREETPDGYVKMLLGMMLQFFIPTDFSQTCFSQKWGKIFIRHSLFSIPLSALVLFTLVVGDLFKSEVSLTSFNKVLPHEDESVLCNVRHECACDRFPTFSPLNSKAAYSKAFFKVK